VSWFHAFNDALTEWGFALGQTLSAQLEAGSVAAILVVFAAGLLTSFTPCVYPMIPVTVTYIGGAAAGSRRRAVRLSLVYVLGMAAVYACLGVVTALLGRTFGEFTYNPWVYGAVGAIIVIFGLAMLGALTFAVPGFAARIQSQGARRGGYLGAALMGAAAGFVAAPCTAPVLGLLLVYVARTRDVVWGGSLLLVFALGLGLLLMVLGIFSGLITALPRAGAWMDWIKKAFGAGMLLIGGYFLRRAVTMVLAGGAP
jgi:thiol:disulfide interchange protein DsbD